MSTDGILVLLAVAAVVVGWASQNTGRIPGGRNRARTAPTDVNATGQGDPASPSSTGLNNQSGTFSTGVQ